MSEPDVVLRRLCTNRTDSLDARMFQLNSKARHLVSVACPRKILGGQGSRVWPAAPGSRRIFENLEKIFLTYWKIHYFSIFLKKFQTMR